MPSKPVQPSRAGTVPWPADLVERYVAEGHWKGQALASRFVAAADATPDVEALTDGDFRLTYAELLSRVDGAAQRLRALGLRPDDRLLVQLPNGWEFVVLTLACFRLGVIPVMALIQHRRHELSYLAELSEARAIAVPDRVKDFDHQELAAGIAAGAETIEHVIVAGDVRDGHVDLRALCAPASDPAAARAELDALTPDPRSVALLILSGGTTGLPKLIARTHDDYACYVDGSADAFGFDASSVYLAVLPFGHNYPLSAILGVLWAGGRVVVSPSPSPRDSLGAIEAERATVTSVVPAIVVRWLEYREADKHHDLSSFKVLTLGAARLQDQLVRQISSVFGCTLQQGYGMAEGLTNLTRLDDPFDITCDTQGRPINPADELRVVDPDGNPVPPDEQGELITRGPYTIRGYYRAPEHNERAFTPDGWYRTGDVVRLRPDGYVVVEGRTKDVINRGGEKIAAEEVESFAYQLDSVEMAASVAMPDPVLGERGCLYVVPTPGTSVALQDVIDVMETAGVARFKLPERLVIVDAMPRTPIGKIDKKVLRADIARRLEEEAA
ncbi:Triostin synthetase I [Amycolatopsis sp. MJM2582]|uniref:(2,3-dihydroxybenzoyl)adenylate synthase n=1 Tax=Amycolatopsis TaxID=1813 RepID=UPI000508D3A7|nr:AMP-binding protein [Amycolatopsis sp. MJM2582]KFZ80003.1 Triostin synthetase I [Amycolatopsis sp. MJM2582]